MRSADGEEREGLLGGKSDDGSIIDAVELELEEIESRAPEHALPFPRRPRRSCWKDSKLISYLCPSASRRTRRSTFPRRIAQGLFLCLCIVPGLLGIFGVFLPSYSHPPQRYTALRRRVNETPDQTGRANVNNITVFIAAALFDADGELVSGDWGRSVTGLIHILGPENVHLSVYENDADERSTAALYEFEKRLSCNSSIVVEEVDLSQFARVSTADGRQKVKRIAFLAEVRNRALRPLLDEESPASKTHFERLLYINDIVFDPIDAANLLFSTAVDEKTGTTRYRAACATDFINPWKFYDTFATRDLEGRNIGVPFYPWFTGAGEAMSRQDVLAQKDAVRVKSCWGGMVSFEARWFQPWVHSAGTVDVDANQQIQQSVRFRAENETYWDASECCLVHADIAALALDEMAVGETGVFMNPYIRVAYSKATLDWLPFTKRFERLYSPFHTVVNWIAKRPGFNARYLEQPGKEVVDRVWVWDAESRGAMQNGAVDELPNGIHGMYENVSRIATPGAFCGERHLSWINEEPRKGEARWGTERAPARR
ncbi:hypothetical protein LTR85_004225 [Meristemomyces frigidus]|nr:hypothetical protein LTR85_004225 [Meristemomyces frigidus]